MICTLQSELIQALISNINHSIDSLISNYVWPVPYLFDCKTPPFGRFRKPQNLLRLIIEARFAGVSWTIFRGSGLKKRGAAYNRINMVIPLRASDILLMIIFNQLLLVLSKDPNVPFFLSYFFTPSVVPVFSSRLLCFGCCCTINMKWQLYGCDC